ncbi:MAG: hypothetical protein ABEJ78_07675 [Haloferacaceae archaeon]
MNGDGSRVFGPPTAPNPTTQAEFDAALEALVRAARDNGVDVAGSWPYRYDGVFPDYEVRVERLAKPRRIRGD